MNEKHSLKCIQVCSVTVNESESNLMCVSILSASMEFEAVGKDFGFGITEKPLTTTRATTTTTPADGRHTPVLTS